jgi:hypothetical protein
VEDENRYNQNEDKEPKTVFGLIGTVKRSKTFFGEVNTKINSARFQERNCVCKIGTPRHNGLSINPYRQNSYRSPCGI